MANFLGGTGMCFETNLLKEIGWGATSLVEDLEFTMRGVMRGVYPKFNYDAKVFDEKPLTFKASARQRLRWMQGHFTVARRYFFPPLWRAIKERVPREAGLGIVRSQRLHRTADFLVDGHHMG